ncbi:MAG: metalloregulator ArsR/SmtB family transcription factor [Hyphomonas sp.]
MSRKPAIRTDDVFRALADPVRRSLLVQLNRAPQPVEKLAAQYGISRPAISRHLGVLRDCGVVASRPQGKENVYYLIPTPMREVQDWLAQFWASRLADLKSLAESGDPQ